jgi:hypothetical protein
MIIDLLNTSGLKSCSLSARSCKVFSKAVGARLIAVKNCFHISIRRGKENTPRVLAEAREKSRVPEDVVQPQPKIVPFAHESTGLIHPINRTSTNLMKLTSSVLKNLMIVFVKAFFPKPLNLKLLFSPFVA